MPPLGLALSAVLLTAEPSSPPRDPRVEVGGHVKSFLVAFYPYEHLLMPPEPAGQTTLSSRLKFVFRQGSWLKAELHPEVNLRSGALSSIAGLGTGVGARAEELLPLSHTFSEGELSGLLRVDRALVAFKREGLEATVGRQAIGFGQGRVFTPLDLINPFTPTTLDTEYRPGVDAARVEAFLGSSTRLGALAAWLGDASLDELALAAHAQTTFGATDVALLAGAIRGTPSMGASLWAPLGPVGAYTDASLFLEDSDVEARGVIGCDWRPTEKTSLNAEFYVQTFGTDRLEDYLVQAAGDRYQRGELWLYGHTYASIGVQQELRPLLHAGAFAVVNLQDPSALLSGNLSWSAAENADLGLGMFMGLGKRPDPVEPLDLLDPSGQPRTGFDLLRTMGVRSEFGLLPFVAFAQTRLYF